MVSLLMLIVADTLTPRSHLDRVALSMRELLDANLIRDPHNDNAAKEFWNHFPTSLLCAENTTIMPSRARWLLNQTGPSNHNTLHQIAQACRRRNANRGGEINRRKCWM